MKARVFWSGNSQAVRLPKAFRLDATEVVVSRDGPRIVLQPVARKWSERFLKTFGAIPDIERPPQPAPQKRRRIFD